MAYTERGTVENFIVQELKDKLGWEYVGPSEMKNRRGRDYEEPLVAADLRKALRKINNAELTDADLDFILVSIRSMPANIEGVRRFLDVLRNGVLVPLQKEEEERVIRLIDFENPDNNEFIATNQYRLEGSRGSTRPDIVLLVNGIPLVLIQCKSPVREDVDWTDAYKDVKDNEEKAPELFKYVQVSIATDGAKTHHFPNGFNEEDEDFLSVWKDPSPFKKEDIGKDTLRTTICGLLHKPNLLDLVENFIFVRQEKGRATKVMARYMQFRATNRISQRVVDTLQGKDEKKFGLVWHWQGSGKTYTMAFAAWKLYQHPATENPSIFVIVDRRMLEDQIEKDFAFLGIQLETIGSIRKLLEVLRWGKEVKRGIFLVTIEKFSPKYVGRFKKEGESLKVARENVIVLADEVHRTHYGVFSTLMRSIFKNAFIFGFTGTPLSRRERNTFQQFCPPKELYLDRYSMLDALEDGFTVSLCYQPRLPKKYHLKGQQLKELVEFEEERIRTLSSAEQKELRKKVSAIRALAKKPDRIKDIAQDIQEHFTEIVEPTELKAMIVTVDREACVMYKNALDEYLPSEQSEIVMTFNLNEKKRVIRNYVRKVVERYGTKSVKEIHERVTDAFKTKANPKVLIVTDMLLTGFDAPNLWTMYLDKPLKEHRVLQAIARTNRPFPNKKFGSIVDYIGVLADVEKAFRKYEAGDQRALKVVIRRLDKERQAFKAHLEEALQLFEHVKREDTHESLESALDLLIDPARAQDFESAVKELMKSYEMLSGEPFLLEHLSDYRWLTKIYVAYNKKFKKASVDELKIERLSKKTVSLMQQTIDVGAIEEKYPTVSIDASYIKVLKKRMGSGVGAAIDVASDLQREARAHPDSPFFMDLSGEIERTYKRLRERKVVTEEVMKKLLDIGERIVQWRTEEEEIGSEKYPIYEAIKSMLPDLPKETTLTFTEDLLNGLRKSKLLFKGWQRQRDVRRRVRGQIRFNLISAFKERGDKVDDLMESISGALEGIG